MSALALLPPQHAPSWEATLPGLRKVIERLMDDKRLSYSDLAKRTGMTRSHLQKIATEKNARMPAGEDLDRIAIALGQHPNVLREAAHETYGVQIEGDPTPGADRDLLASIVQLDDKRKATLAKIVRAMIEEGDE